jgi:ERCC4-type nuclease
LKIICDSREGLPYTFKGLHFRDVEVTLGTLKTGDYSIEGFENHIACERKSIDDLISCLMGENRQRFKRELERGGGLRSFAVFVEASWEDLCKGRYVSNMRPISAVMSILSMAQEFNVGFFFCGTRVATEFAVYGYLKQFWDDREKERKAGEKDKHDPR